MSCQFWYCHFNALLMSFNRWTLMGLCRERRKWGLCWNRCVSVWLRRISWGHKLSARRSVQSSSPSQNQMKYRQAILSVCSITYVSWGLYICYEMIPQWFFISIWYILFQEIGKWVRTFKIIYLALLTFGHNALWTYSWPFIGPGRHCAQSGSFSKSTAYTWYIVMVI